MRRSARPARVSPLQRGTALNLHTFIIAGFFLALFLFLLAPLRSSAQEREPLEVYRSRRAALSHRLSDGLVILFGNAEAFDSYHVFRQENNFYYLTGYDEPDAVLVLAPPFDNRKSPLFDEFSKLPHEILFVPSRDPEEEIWTGTKADPNDSATAARLGVDSVLDAARLAEELRRYSKAYSTLYVLTPSPHGGDLARKDNIDKLKTLLPFANIIDVGRVIGAMRQVKTEGEIKMTERAVSCTMDGIRAAARELHPGEFEYEAAATLKYNFEREGCLGLAFDPIVGSGIRSTILHYTKSTGRMEDGDVVVMDVGAEYSYYAADITRTFPVNGRFTARQREIYNIVLGAQNAAIAAIKPGMRITGHGSDSLYQIAFDYINTHGKDSQGRPLGRYFTHGLSHHVGLDVHDAGDPARPLEPGMVVTMEPGIYLPDEKIGVRIEDMVLVTKTGGALLTEKLPREADEIERMMKER